MVYALDSREIFNVLADIVDFDAVGDRLEEDARGGFAEGNGGAEDDDGDDEGDGGIEVIASGEIGEPDDEGGDDDSNVAEGVAHDVEEDSLHVKVIVGVTATTTATLSGFAVVVLGVVNGGAAGDGAVAGVVCNDQRVDF